MPSRWPPVGAETDPLMRARELQKSWERLLADGALGPELPPGATAGLRPTIVESWRRSLATGLDPTGLLAPIEADESEVVERWFEHPLGSLTHLLTEQLGKVAEESRSIVVVTDASGLVLHRVGDEWLKERAAEMNLVEGARYSEAADGTNGIGTALTADQAFQVFAFEHFNERHHEWVCAGAPVHDPVSGRTIGLIDLSSLWKIAHPRSLELVTTAARTIERRLLEVRRDQDARLRRRYGDLITRSTDLLVNRDGYALAGAEQAHSKPLDVPEGGGEVVLRDGSAGVAEPLGRGEAYLVRPVAARHARSAPVEVLERSEKHVRELITEQSALRQVATLVARESAPDQLFAAVAEQVARVFAVPHVRLVRFEPEGSVVVGGFSEGDREPFPMGSRWPRYSKGAIATVRQTGRPARMEDYGHLSGEMAAVFRDAGVHSAVASPIVVEGRLWGAMVIHSARYESFPESTEARLEDFTELVATAIANAESRAAVARLADEHAALHRVATLVAQGASPRDLFAAVAKEVGRVLQVASATMGRYEPDDTVTTVASWSMTGPAFPIGKRWPMVGTNVAWLVLRTGQAARIDDFSAATDPIGVLAREMGAKSAVASPIVVDGHVWGVITATSNEGALPPDTEARLASFTELVATAIANTEAREALAQLADEQAALRRVATLVAQDTAPAEIFAAVSAEVDRVFRLDPATFDIAVVGRFDDGPELVVVAVSRRVEVLPIGSRWPPDELFAPAHVLRTGRSARIRAAVVASAGGEVAEFLRQHGYLSQVACPIVVDGHLWGAMSVNARNDFPPDTEERLERFTELVATAIANATSRETLAQLADEQAALRRVATLIAREAALEAVFAKVAEDVARTLGDVDAALWRDDDDQTLTAVAVRGPSDAPGVRLGTRLTLDGDSVVERVLREGRPQRIDDFSQLAGSVAERARQLGMRSAIGCPIVVGSRTWGVMTVATYGADPFAPETETRVARFSDLVATAIANAESRDALARLAEQQAALRRVATLVAENVSQETLFAAVAEEVAGVLGLDQLTIDRYDADSSTVIASLIPGFPVGSRWPFEGSSLGRTVFETGRPARIDDYSELTSTAAEVIRSIGFSATVGAPIIVEGRVWGVICVAALAPLPADTEERLVQFTELVATAIANAEGRSKLAESEARALELAREQAALRRVATLVARDAAPGEVFDAVAREVGKLLDADITVVGRYDADDAATAIGSWSSAPGEVPVGTRSAVGGRNVLTLVAETKRPARVDGYDEGSGEAADIARRYGWCSSIAAPISVEGRVWGVMLVATKRSELFPVGAEERLSAFTDLVATSLANAEAQDELRRYADEQASLQRVATLVAQGMPPAAIFSAASREVEALLGADAAAVVRFEHDPPAMIIVGTGDNIRSSAIGVRSEFVEGYASTGVFKTGRSARVEAREGEVLDGPVYSHAQVAATGDSLRFKSAAASPLVVEGKLWGAMTVSATRSLAPDTEARLERFTDIVATAIANADSREALATLAAEQAALRRIATHVAQGGRPEEIFSAVTEEVAAAMGAMAAVARFDDEGRALVITGISEETGVPIGARLQLSDEMACAEVYRTRRPARVDGYDWSTRSGPVAEAGRRLGIVSQVATPIIVEGHLWGTIIAIGRARLAEDAEQRMERFTELLATAIANAESKHELAASLRRIVSAGDEARRLIERDLHDGIQQRLIALSFRARAMTRRPPGELPGLAAELSEGLKDASDELREISRGIHPTILTEAGLGPALRALGRRSDVPIDVDVRLDERLPGPVEAAAYYIASEALTNVAKHAHANVVELIAAHDNGILTLEVRDDGIGGVDATRGTGILGLTDRAEALGGTISIASPPHGGTTLSVHLPSTA